jgi:hypothetical protein
VSTQQERGEEYLQQAKEADKRAEKTVDPQAKAVWERIANDFRELAKICGIAQLDV